MNRPVGVDESPPSLLRDNIRRSIVVGRIYLVIGTGYIVFLSVVLRATSGVNFLAGVDLFLPIFAVVGSMGGMMVFTNDRLKGVFEYLIAYGISPRRIFSNVLLACVAMAAIILGVTMIDVVGLSVSIGAAPSTYGIELLVVYSLPMSFASVAFAAMVGMFWTSLSSPRSGMTGSVGLLPIVGIAPSILTLSIAETVGANALYVVVGAVVFLTALTLALLTSIGRLLPSERLLSQA
ncbi:MAG: hypothetical protein WBG19_02760 [Thermoplasmata archaeon]